MGITKNSDLFEKCFLNISAHPINFTDFIGESEEILKVYEMIVKLSDIDSSVLILGESGSGKELIASALHINSSRGNRPMVVVNCGAIPEELLESELFGHERGAFTGALRNRIGKFERANSGTIFLDEIGDMNPSLQIKLLRVLQEREFERVGGTNKISVNVRIIAATNQNLEKAIEEGRFREDLYYRLNVVPINAPPLRKRRTDIALLLKHFIKHFNSRFRRNIEGVNNTALKALISYEWPGNVRELKHLIERIVALKGFGLITEDDLPEKISTANLLDFRIDDDKLVVKSETEAMVDKLEVADEKVNKDYSEKGALYNRNTPSSVSRKIIPESGLDLKAEVDKFETALIIDALDQSKWVKNKAAALLRLNRTTLVEKLKKKKIFGKISGYVKSNEQTVQ